MTLQILTLSLLTSIPAACGDDAEPTRPADGTVKVWESCVWDGQQEPALCEPELSCSRHGVCSPICETISDCPEIEGFDLACNSADLADICIPMCNTANECPKTGGVDLKCSDFLCIGDS
ncbi:MAG: hypothetical protein JNL82_36405 [Myxococcales bacterium]|nr:hypothetical protein [Myxococcales bacterium]